MMGKVVISSLSSKLKILKVTSYIPSDKLGFFDSTYYQYIINNASIYV